jgi:adenylate kinase family enzyme
LNFNLVDDEIVI